MPPVGCPAAADVVTGFAAVMPLASGQLIVIADFSRTWLQLEIRLLWNRLVL